MAVQTVSNSPVEAYDHSLDVFRRFVHDHAPYTFIAYRSLIPEKEDDWYYLATKVAWFVFVVFNFVELAASWCAFVAVIPFVPLVFDAIWNAHRYLHPHGEALAISPALMHGINIAGLVAFSALGILLLYKRSALI
jgi:hypothetical protein